MAFDPIAYINEPRWQRACLGLDRIEEVLERLGNPQKSLRFVHVAGTNGKGSTCSYLASILQAAGYRTGLFTSPYIERFEERIRIDGRDISPGDLERATLAVRAAADAMADHPTEFELMCAVALVHFAQQGCDIVVMEVGLGGRWDATNVIESPEVSVICRIGIDHTDILGTTLADIAAEKAGIVKDGCPVVSWPQDPSAMAVIEHAANDHASTLHVVDFSQLSVQDARISLGTAADPADGCGPAGARALPRRRFAYRGREYETRLLASYQPRNAALALEAVRVLASRGWNIPEEAVAAGLSQATWPGRFEVCGQAPLTIVDGGHNQQGAAALAETVREVIPGVRPAFVIGVLADKDYPAMLREITPLGSAFATVTPDSPRALGAAGLAEAIESELAHGRRPCAEGAGTPAASSPEAACMVGTAPSKDAGTPVYVADSMEDALRWAKEQAEAGGAVCAFGSLYSVGSVKAALRRQAKADARRALKAARASLPAASRQAADDAIERAVCASEAFARAKYVLSYVSAHSEVPTRGIIEQAWREGKAVAVPRCIPGTRRMAWHAIASFDELRESAFGIPEPPADAATEIDLAACTEAGALAIVPGLAFDRHGYRIGYGGGFYDTFLESFGGASMGLCRSAFLHDALDPMIIEAHDLPVGAVATDAGIIRCDAGNKARA